MRFSLKTVLGAVLFLALMPPAAKLVGEARAAGFSSSSAASPSIAGVATGGTGTTSGGVTATAAADNVDYNLLSGFFKPPTGTFTFSGTVAHAANANAFDLSGGSGSFKPPTGTFTFGGVVAHAVNANAFDLSGGTGNFLTPTGNSTIGGGNSTVTVSTGTKAVSFGATAATAGAGFRNGNTRTILRKYGTAIDCAAGNLTPTVAQVLDTGLFTCATSQTVTLPTAQGAAGLVQALPGTPAVGDEFTLVLAENHATNTNTLVAGTGGTIYGIATITNGSRKWFCVVTAITGNAETYTCY